MAHDRAEHEAITLFREAHAGKWIRYKRRAIDSGDQWKTTIGVIEGCRCVWTRLAGRSISSSRPRGTSTRSSRSGISRRTSTPATTPSPEQVRNSVTKRGSASEWKSQTLWPLAQRSPTTSARSSGRRSRWLKIKKRTIKEFRV